MNKFSIPFRQFALGGNATFTAVSKKTGARFTFKVCKPSKEKPFFVSVLTGQDNENDFTFLGTIFDGGKYVKGRRSSILESAPSAVAFEFVWNRSYDLPEGVEIFHEGKCCCCGRKLTVPESIASGVGPECAKKLFGGV
jgi:hypothetical protein